MTGTDKGRNRFLKRLKIALKNVYWRVYGVFLTYPAVPAFPRSFLFVCKGNICRSPFAEAAARRHAQDGLRAVLKSAGIIVGQPLCCPEETLSAAGKFGIDLSKHRSRGIDEELVDGADMIFAMEAWQYRHLRKAFPKHRNKIFLLALFEENPPERRDAHGVLNILDPYGRGMEDFMECFERIDACLRGVFSSIQGRP